MKKKINNCSKGNGPVDATFNAIKELTDTNFKLKAYTKFMLLLQVQMPKVK